METRSQLPALSDDEIANLLVAYLADSPGAPAVSAVSKELRIPANLYHQLSIYLDLLLKWNARTNLTAIRDPREIVRRHFGESLFAGRHLGKPATLLDVGSGAGFPGLPIALLHPEIHVTLAESQNKKATFLREAVRALGVSNVEVWGGRAEALPASRHFDAVTLRAVDNMGNALVVAKARVLSGGRLMILATLGTLGEMPAAGDHIALPNSQSGILYTQTL